MDGNTAIEGKQIRDRAKAFARRFVGTIFRNLIKKILPWGCLFFVVAFVYSRLVFSGEGVPEAFRTIGTVGVLGVYLAAGIVTGLYFGVLAAVRGMSSDLSEVVDTVVDKGLVVALPAERETVSVEEVRRILDKVAPEDGGFSGFPLRLVRKKILAEMTARSDAAGMPNIKVTDMRKYATGKLTGAVTGDLEMKAKIGWLAGFFLLPFFLPDRFCSL